MSLADLFERQPKPHDPPAEVDALTGQHSDADESLSWEAVYPAKFAASPALAALEDDLDQPDDLAPLATSTVEFTRYLREGMRGNDVVAYKRALSRAGFMAWGHFTDVFGPNMAKAVSKFRKQHGLGTQPSIGPKTHVALTLAYKKGTNNQRAMDDYARTLLHDYWVAHHINPELMKRQAIVAEWLFMYQHRYDCLYRQWRPVPLVRPPAFAHATDCSGLIILGYYVGGARNPNVISGHRLPYNGQGYTQSILQAGVKCSRSDLEPADVVMYGYTVHPSGAFPMGSPTHVAGWTGEPGALVVSNGSYPMRHAPYNYRHDVNCYVHLEV